MVSSKMIAMAPNQVFVSGRIFAASDIRRETTEIAECMVPEGDKEFHRGNRSDASIQHETELESSTSRVAS